MLGVGVRVSTMWVGMYMRVDFAVFVGMFMCMFSCVVMVGVRLHFVFGEYLPC